MVRLATFPGLKKVGFALLAGGFALAAGLNAATNIVRETNPELALSFTPSDGGAHAQQAEMLVRQGLGTIAARNAVAAAARAALVASPLNAAALRLLALAEENGNAPERTRQLMTLAERLSRRDLATQLWLIEDAVRRDDVDAAIDHYDVALSTHEAANDLLYPVLANALDAPRIQIALARAIQQKRPWVPGFLDHAIGNSADPRDIANLLERASLRERDPIYRPREAALLGKLVSAGQYGDARRYFLQLAGADSSILADPRFNTASTDSDFNPISWELTAGDGIEATLVPGNQLEIRAGSGERAVAARRILFLPEGAYRFRQTVRTQGPAPPVQTVWQLSCMRPEGPVLVWQMDVPSDKDTSRTGAEIRIPDACSAQTLELIASGPDAQADAILFLDAVSLKRVGS